MYYYMIYPDLKATMRMLQCYCNENIPVLSLYHMAAATTIGSIGKNAFIWRRELLL